MNLSVENPFDPETSKANKGIGFGLDAIRRRLLLMYSRNDLFTIEKHENTYRTLLRIPQVIYQSSKMNVL